MKEVFTSQIRRGKKVLLGSLWLLLLTFISQGAFVLPGLELPQDPEFSGQAYDTQVDYEEITPDTWRSLYLEMRKADGSTVNFAVVLQLSSGSRIVYEDSVDNSATNPATKVVNVVFPLNTQTKVFVWTIPDL